MAYNYREHLKADVVDCLDLFDVGGYDDVEEFAQKMEEELWVMDSVTGNGSGSYTFSREDAKANVLANLDLLHEAMEDFEITDEEVGKRFMADDWEWFDVIIRCSLLSGVCEEVAEEYKDKFVA